MKAKSIFAAMAGFSAGIAAGWLLAQHIGIDCCCESENAHHKHGTEKPPLHVKPVPIVKHTVSNPVENAADEAPQGDVE